jgi:hypothetical protein
MAVEYYAWWVEASLGDTPFDADIVLAPEPVLALKYARRVWPTADSLRVLGRQNPDDPNEVFGEDLEEVWPTAKWVVEE